MGCDLRFGENGCVLPDQHYNKKEDKTYHNTLDQTEHPAEYAVNDTKRCNVHESRDNSTGYRYDKDDTDEDQYESQNLRYLYRSTVADREYVSKKQTSDFKGTSYEAGGNAVYDEANDNDDYDYIDPNHSGIINVLAYKSIFENPNSKLQTSNNIQVTINGDLLNVKRVR